MKFVDNAPEAVLAAAKEMLRRGLTEGTAGNISARQEDGTIIVTPTSVDYDQMEVDDLVVLDTESRQAGMIADDLERLLGGDRPLHIMNPEVLK